MSAPLRLTNQLPVSGSLLVWEQQAGSSKDLVGRQTVQVASGATVPIHTGEGGSVRLLCECMHGIECGIVPGLGEYRLLLAGQRRGRSEAVHACRGSAAVSAVGSKYVSICAHNQPAVRLGWSGTESLGAAAQRAHTRPACAPTERLAFVCALLPTRLFTPPSCLLLPLDCITNLQPTCGRW